MNRLRLVVVFIGLTLAARPLFAQAKPRQHADVTVALTFAVSAEVDCGFDFSEANTSSVSAFTLGHSGIGTWSYSAPMAFTVTPGKSYQIHLSAATSSWDQTQVRIGVEPGYQVFVTYTNDRGAGNGVPQTSYVARPILDHHYAYITVLPQDGSQILGPSQCNPPKVADLLWAVGLGQTLAGRTAGSVMLRSTAVSSSLFDPSALILSEISGDVNIAYGSSGEIRQIFAPQTFVDVYPITQLGALPGFEMDFYGPQTCPNPVATITPSGSPYASIYVQNDHDSSSGLDRLRITRTEGSVSRSWRVTQAGSSSTWTIEEINTGGRTSTFQSTIVSGQRNETVQLKDASNTVALQTKRIYNTNDELITEIADPNGAALTTTYTYYDQTADAGTGNQDRLKSVLRPDGSWVKYEYYGAYSGSTGWSDLARFGQLKAVYKSWRDSSTTPDTATASNCDYTLYDYASSGLVFSDALASVVESVNGQNVSKTLYNPSFGTSVGGEPLRSETVQTYTGSSSYLTSTRKIFHNTADADYAGRQYTQTNPDGSKTSSYVHRGYLDGYGNFVPTSSSTDSLGYVTMSGWSTAVTGGVSFTSVDGQSVDQIYLVPNRSTRTAAVLSPGGTTYVHTVTQLYTGGTSWVTLNHETTWYDGSLWIYTTESNGQSSTREWGDGSLPSLDIANDGELTGYSFDDIGHKLWQRKYNAAAYGSYQAQGWLYTHYQYDAAGHVTWQRVNNSSDPSVAGLTATSAYDLAGRLTSSTDATGLTTTYSYSNGGRTVTTTYPGGGTKTTDNYLDGSPKSVTGTAVANSFQATTINSDGTLTSTTYALRSSDVSSPTAAPRWASSTTDWAGRKLTDQHPAPGGTFTRNYYYDSSGRLNKTTEPGLADTLTVYDTYGNAYRTGLDIDASGTLDTTSSTDRLTETDVTFAQDGGGAWWRVTTSLGFNQASSGTSYTSSTVKERLTGFSGTLQQETISIDLFGNQTDHTVNVDSTHTLVTDTTTLPDSSTPQVVVSYNGLTVSQQSAQGLTTYTQYDSLGRPSATIDPRLGTSTVAYYTSGTGSTGQIASSTDAAGNTTSYTYESATGRLSGTTNALGKTAYQSYNTRGQVTNIWGQTTYPVQYGFDDYGEQTTMSTYRGGTGWDASTWPSSPGTADTTTWAYDAATGTLTSKTDAASHAVAYTYNTRGQLATRTWARGTVATYSYSATTAEQTGISYSDSTPAITYAYNRMGQTATVADVTGTRGFAYSTTTTALTSETLPSYFDARVLTRKYDTTTTGAIGRNVGFTLSGASGSGTDSDVSYGYDATGRFNGLSTPSSGPAFTYAFTTGSNLVASITDTSGWTETNTYEAHRNLLTNIDGQFSTAVKAQFAYTHDALGRRATVVDSGEIFARYVNSGLATHYGYNDRSEVTSAQSYYGTSATDTSYPVAARGFNYAFDNIGSRTSSSVIGADSSDVQTTTYANNNLNQVTSRTSPASVNVTGLAPTAATVTVNSAAVTRQGDYYYQNVTSGSTPAWLSLAASSSLGGSTTRYSYLAATPESYTYDADGNLTDDGRWHYIWDAENRLVSMETSLATSVLSTGVPRQFIQFQYDYLGRRVRKTVANWNGSAYVAALDRKFIYNGWNLIAEYNAPSSGAWPLAVSYVWGLDLSGNLTDGGGVGGLLAIKDASSGAVHLPFYDANGNLHALVNRADGSVTAAYEYNPFGETLRSTGSYAATNSFRFSTKYTDAETQFVYYGYRYYNPTLGRWLGRDPLEEKGGLHLYAFCRNNAVNAWDALGESGVVNIPLDQGDSIPDDSVLQNAHPTWQKINGTTWQDTADGTTYNYVSGGGYNWNSENVGLPEMISFSGAQLQLQMSSDFAKVNQFNDEVTAAQAAAVPAGNVTIGQFYSSIDPTENNGNNVAGSAKSTPPPTPTPSSPTPVSDNLLLGTLSEMGSQFKAAATQDLNGALNALQPIAQAFDSLTALAGSAADEILPGSGQGVKNVVMLGSMLDGIGEDRLLLESAENAGAATYEDLVAAAQDAYPTKAGKIELHHITPKYLGGDPEGPLVPLDAAYHQQITNEFRNLWPYGGPQPSTAQLEEMMQQVYQKFPLPPGN